VTGRVTSQAITMREAWGNDGARCAGALVLSRKPCARQLIRDRLESEIGPILTNAFPFAGRRCERLTETVMKRLGFSAD